MAARIRGLGVRASYYEESVFSLLMVLRLLLAVVRATCDMHVRFPAWGRGGCTIDRRVLVGAIAVAAVTGAAAGLLTGLRLAGPAKRVQPVRSEAGVGRTRPAAAGHESGRAGGDTSSGEAKRSVRLNVRVLPTRYGISGREEPSYPSTIEVRLPERWASEVEAYGVAGLVLLGPKNWTGAGSVGANGSRGARLQPPGGPSPSAGAWIWYADTGGCAGCAVIEAAQYFDSVRDRWDGSYGTLPERPPGVQSHLLSPRLLAYRIPDAGFEVNGVAYTPLTDSDISTAEPPWFVQLETALPAEQHGLATVILNDFIARHLSVKSRAESPLTRGTGGSDAPGQNTDVKPVGNPRWWVVPFRDGWGNPNEGRLYFGLTLENHLNRPVEVGVSFRSYKADGTPYEGCVAPLGGEGPGVKAIIAPREKALVTCNRAIVRRDTANLKVTARLWNVRPLRQPEAGYEVVEAGLGQRQTDGTETSYEPFALVKAKGGRDVRASLIFRFYDAGGVQVGTCESDEALVEPEVPQKMTCIFPMIIDVASPQPVTVRAEPRPESGLPVWTAES